MTALVDNSLLDDVTKRNSMAITLNIHTKSHTICGRSTLKLLEHFGNVDSETSQKSGRNLKEFFYERILVNLLKSSSLRCYVKVIRVTKNLCKLHTKSVRLNKIVQHEKKYLLNCSVRIYQRI